MIRTGVSRRAQTSSPRLGRIPPYPHVSESEGERGELVDSRGRWERALLPSNSPRAWKPSLAARSTSKNLGGDAPCAWGLRLSGGAHRGHVGDRRICFGGRWVCPRGECATRNQDGFERGRTLVRGAGKAGHVGDAVVASPSTMDRSGSGEAGGGGGVVGSAAGGRVWGGHRSCGVVCRDRTARRSALASSSACVGTAARLLGERRRRLEEVRFWK